MKHVDFKVTFFKVKHRLVMAKSASKLGDEMTSI